MDKNTFNPDDFFKKACYFEASLIALAIVLGWMAEINPLASLYFSEQALAYGIIGTVPLYLMFLTLEHVQISSVIKIRNLLIDTLGPGLHRYSWADLFVLAAIAGVSEEMVFRGVIQPWMETSWSMKTALIGSNIVFGLAHALTPLYAVLAFMVGIYLSLSMDYGGDRNLMTPIIIHGLYDFLAFMALMKAYRSKYSVQ